MQDYPPEFRLSIFQHVQELAFLRNLIRASSVANTAFNESPLEIFSHVAHKAPKELQQIIHAIAACHAPNAKVHLVDGPIVYNREASFNVTTDVEDDLPDVSFDLPVNLKQVLEFAHRIQLLSSLYLSTHLRRLNDLTPEHLAKPTFLFSSYPFRKYPEGKRYQPAKTGQASWVEEYRVIRALWRIQLLCILTKPKFRVTPNLNIEAASVECILPQHQNALVRILSHLTQWELDEMMGVQDYLETARISLRAPISAPQETEAAPTTSAGQATNASTPTTNSNVPPIYPTPATTRSTVPPSPFQRYSDIIAIKHSTEAYNFFNRWGLRHPTSPLQRSTWQNFRRLGFGIWDQERMCMMELFRVPVALREQTGAREMSIDDVGFTWRSVEGVGEKEVKVEELSGKMGELKVGDKKSMEVEPKKMKIKPEKVLKKKEEKKGLGGLKGLMRSRTKTLAAGSATGSDDGSERSSIESFGMMKMPS